MQNEYLMHFNPFHDPKNGQFTSGGSSGGYREALKNVSKVDRKVNKDISKLAKLNSKQSRTFNKYQKKISRAKSEEKQTKLLNKFEEKHSKIQNKANELQNRMLKNEFKAYRYLRKAASKGYNIDSTHVSQNAIAGRIIAQNILSGPLGKESITRYFAGEGED